MTETPTNDAQQPGTEVQVEVSGCHETDAQAVFAALCTVYAADRAPDEPARAVSGAHPTVWAVTLDVGDRRGTAPPPRLGAPVTLDVQGGYHAVDLLRGNLAKVFAVDVVGTASGDQENEVQLRLGNRDTEA